MALGCDDGVVRIIACLLGRIIEVELGDLVTHAGHRRTFGVSASCPVPVHLRFGRLGREDMARQVAHPRIIRVIRICLVGDHGL